MHVQGGQSLQIDLISEMSVVKDAFLTFENTVIIARWLIILKVSCQRSAAEKLLRRCWTYLF